MVGMFLGFMTSHMVDAQEIKELAEEVQNPVSDLVRVGFLNNTFFGAGANDHVLKIFRPLPQGNLATGLFSTA
jgi:hypothetical protein